MTTYLQMEANALDIATAAIMLVVQAIAAILWLIAQCLGFGVRATLKHWRIVVAVGVAYILATQPHITLAIILIVAYAKFAKP